MWFQPSPKLPIPKQNSVLFDNLIQHNSNPKIHLNMFFIDLITQLKHFFDILLFRRRKNKAIYKKFQAQNSNPNFFASGSTGSVLHKENSDSEFDSSSENQSSFGFGSYQLERELGILLTETGIDSSYFYYLGRFSRWLLNN